MTKKETIARILIVIVCLCIVAILFSVALWLSSGILIGNLKSYNDFRVNGEYIDYLNTVPAKGKYNKLEYVATVKDPTCIFYCFQQTKD